MEPHATFSACSGAAFMGLHPARYAGLLAEKIRQHHTEAWLVNTCWADGPYGIGQPDSGWGRKLRDGLTRRDRGGEQQFPTVGGFSGHGTRHSVATLHQGFSWPRSRFSARGAGCPAPWTGKEW